MAGVKFMGRNSQDPDAGQAVLMPTLEATCSLDLGCPVEEFSAFCDEHPERQVVVYANTSAAVKPGRLGGDIEHCAAGRRTLADLGQKIIWAPDRHGRLRAPANRADILMGRRVYCA